MAMDEKEIIARNLATYRKKAGLSQIEFAKKLNYSNKNISKWETGETTPNVFVLRKIAKLFGISVDDLINESTADKQEEVVAKVNLDECKNEFLGWLCFY